MVVRAVLLTTMSIGMHSLSGHDVNKTSVLAPNIRILISFAALFTTWMQPRIGFAIYDARHDLSLNPQPAADGPNPKGFVCRRGGASVHGSSLCRFRRLPPAISDVNLQDHRIRRLVLVHSMIIFLVPDPHLRRARSEQQRLSRTLLRNSATAAGRLPQPRYGCCHRPAEESTAAPVAARAGC